MAGAGLFKLIAKGAVKGIPKAATFGVKHWKGVTAGIVGWKVFAEGKGLVPVASEAILGEDSQKKGLVNTLDHTLRGDSDQGLGEQLIDFVAGEGATQKMTDAIEDAAEKVSEGAEAVKDSVSSAVTSARDAFSGSQTQDLGASMNASLNPFHSLGGLLGGLFGGNFSFANMAGLVAAAFLMFGHFGWMGKIASMLLGTFSLNNIWGQQPAMAYAPQMQSSYTPTMQSSYAEENQQEHKGIRI